MVLRLTVLVSVILAISLPAGAEDALPGLPTTYELMINGEDFVVEANRAVKLRSKTRPGVTYDIAIRVSPVQKMRLNSLRFEYGLRTRVEDNRQAQRRSAKLTHELGFTMLVTDLGEPLEAGSRDTGLQMLTESVVKSYRQRGVKDQEIEVTRLKDLQLKGAEGRGVQIRHKDGDGVEHVTLVYLLVGKTFTGSYIAQYLQADSETALPIIKQTLDSIEATAEQKPTPPKPDGQETEKPS